MMSLQGYIGHLEPKDRGIAREYGEMDSAEFQARIGPEVRQLTELIEGQQARWYNFRVSDLAKAAGSFVSGIVLGGM